MYLKKIFAYILLSVMIFTTACTQGPQMFDFLAPESDPNNFEGSDILIYWNYSAVYSVDKEAKGTPLDDALAERISNISKKYNCNIKLLERQDNEALLINWMNGSYVCDIYAGGIREYAETDLLYPIETFSSIIDFSDEAKFGTKETREDGE